MGHSRPVRSTRNLQHAFALGPVQCRHCAAEWEIDPALLQDCPRCLARAGEPCRRPSGGNTNACIARDMLAMRNGLLNPCTALTWDSRHAKPLPHGVTAL